MLMKIDDGANYSPALEALASLRNAARPKRFRAEKRSRVRALYWILNGVYDRVEAMAIQKVPKLAQTLYTEISGHGGLAIFRRIDAVSLAYERANQKVSSVVVNSNSGFGGRYGGKPARGRGAARGGGRQGGNFNKDECFICYQKGHQRRDCPQARRGAAGGSNNS